MTTATSVKGAMYVVLNATGMATFEVSKAIAAIQTEGVANIVVYSLPHKTYSSMNMIVTVEAQTGSQIETFAGAVRKINHVTRVELLRAS